MRLTLTIEAGPDEVFAADAFAGMVGQVTSVRERLRQYPGTIEAATVSPDGRFAALTIEVGGLSARPSTGVDESRSPPVRSLP